MTNLNPLLIKKNIDMYSLKCDYYDKEFETIDELLQDILNSGMDSSYEITKDGLGIGESAFQLLIP